LRLHISFNIRSRDLQNITAWLKFDGRRKHTELVHVYRVTVDPDARIWPCDTNQIKPWARRLEAIWGI
jgi:hypothetical protein